MVPVLLLAAVLAQAPLEASETLAPVDASVEGRPAPGEVSPLQRLIDAAPAGGTVSVAAGTYRGDLVIDRSLHLVGRGQVLLIGSGAGSVVRVRADDVTVDGFEIDGQEGGSLARDSAGIHVSGHRVTVRWCRIRRSLFGVYLRAADGTTVEHVTVEGLRGRAAGEQGSGVHLWNTQHFRLVDNVIRDSRDGFYIQASSDGYAARNHVTDVRYGLHYMFSDRNVFEDNVFERSAAGAALMYSVDLTFRRNRFLHNRGFASAGLLLKACDRVLAEDNLVADNARGIFLEGSYHNTFRRNLVADADAALVIYDSSHENVFEGNSFVGNLTPLQLSGRRTDTIFDGNYWSDDTGADLDGDGIRDTPYRLSNVFDHLRGRLTAADLFAQGLGAAVLGSAELMFPVLAPLPVLDRRPLARPPHLTSLPELPAPATRRRAVVLWLCAFAGAGAAGVFALGRPAALASAEAA